MKRIDSWLEIQRYIEESSRMPHLPRESKDFIRVEISEIADVRQVRGWISSICVA